MKASLLAAMVAVAGVGTGACSSSSTNPAIADGGAGVLLSSVDGGRSARVVPPPLPFAPANITWTSAVDIGGVQDEDVSTTCVLRTENAGAQSCFSSHAVQFVTTMADRSALHVIVVKSLHVESTGHMTFDNGGIPLAIVSLGDMTISGTINASNTQPTRGPGRGPDGTSTAGKPGIGAGGGSYCGRGGQGGQDEAAAVQPGAPAAAYGSAALSPLLPGSSGGTGTAGAAGGGAIELVAGGTFTMDPGSAIFANGGAATPAMVTGRDGDGGGSGGAILIEAVTVSIAGSLSANGGDGGHGIGSARNSASPSPGINSTAPAPADDARAPVDAMAPDGTQGDAMAPPPVMDATLPGPTGLPIMTQATGFPGGGAGSSGTAIDGSAGGSAAAGGASGGGGGGAGRIRIDAMSEPPTLTGATLSPALGSDPTAGCTTVGAPSPSVQRMQTSST
jgi:hypothetical protein